MIKVITLTVLSSIVLFMSGCSQMPRGDSTQRTKAYAYRIPRPQEQPQIIVQSQQKEEDRQPVSTQQLPPEQTTPLLNKPVRSRMVSLIKSTLGIPYKWGGDNPQRGFDCSGLMRYVHKNAGINIPRTAAQQRDNSQTIDYKQLQPGDMLFFKINRKTNHVGMYIGDRKFIHAPSSGKTVTVASMDSSYWYKRFVKFGTYIN